MLLVKDVMTRDPISIPQNASIDAAIDLIVERNISCVSIVDDYGNLVGVITEYDILKLFDDGYGDKPKTQICRDFMTPKVRTIQQEACLSVAANIFRMASLRRLMVLDQDKLVGVLSRRDVVRSIRDGRLCLTTV
jgi:CBS domain-containing protein